MSARVKLANHRTALRSRSPSRAAKNGCRLFDCTIRCESPVLATQFGNGRDPKTWVLGNQENIETPFRLMVEVGPGKESRWKFAWKRMDR